MKLRVIVVDDEEPARQRLIDLLEREADVELVATHANANDLTLSRSTCDLAFLDVQMPGTTGIDLVRNSDPGDLPMVVFVTAYDRHAIAAFDLHAVDYLLKPYDDERFRDALARARERLRLRQLDDIGRQLAGLVQTIAPPKSYLRRVAVKDGERTVLVPVEKVDYITADGPYAEIHVEKRTFVLRERMHVLEEQLDPEQFVRIHRSTIVRLDRIVALEPYFRGDVIARLRDGTTLTVSRGQKRALEEKLGL
jgi:two-component system, LytTR family, response regulator